MDTALQGLRYATRRLARTPAFTLIALGTLSLAIGASTAAFSFVNGVLLKPLGFQDASRLVYLQGTDARRGAFMIAPQDLIDFRDQTHSFTTVAAIESRQNVNLLRPRSQPLRVNAARVGAEFFTALGTRAQIGRTFAAGEDTRAATKVVVLSDGAWRRYFGGDPRVVGTAVSLDGVPYVIVGVAPPRFSFPDNAELWYPAVWEDWEIGDIGRGNHNAAGIARLRAGVTLASAQRDLNVITSRIAQAFPKEEAGVGVAAVPLRQEIVGEVEAPLWAMLGAVMFVLLIACANVANLLLVRAASRTSEMAVRTALGAGRRQLLGQSLAESMLIAVGGAVLGTIIAMLVVRVLTTLGALALPRMENVGIDARVLAFAAALAVTTGLICGLVPALHVAGLDIAHMLRSSRSGDAASGRARSVLVFTEVALGTVLLVGAGLLIRSFQHLTNVDPGFKADHLVVFDVALTSNKYDVDRPKNAFTDRVQAELATLPGVQSVAVAANRPFDTELSSPSTAFAIDGTPPAVPGTEPQSRLHPVSPAFFRTMGMSVARGRTFTDDENRVDAAPVIVINQALADRYFPGQNPIGQRLTYGFWHGGSADTVVHPQGEIIGVVRNANYASLKTQPEPATFLPYHRFPLGATFVLRTALQPTGLEQEIRRVLASADPDVPMYELGTMSAALDDSVSQSRFYTELLTAFAAIALLLAALGVYGVISYVVSQQSRDFGIRIALGANPRDVANLVMGRGLKLTVPGLVAGLVGALFLTRVIRGLLFGIEPLDRPTLALVVLVFASVGAVASWLPARRASRVDPIIAMRAE
ncbi:MAG TPA: ABC transporter permease [Gemmatimonadaceae bacterium]|nr:ABC transporter permease [Gemmatimonadaceae bacterium]